jgi:hypothetical protein
MKKIISKIKKVIKNLEKDIEIVKLKDNKIWLDAGDAGVLEVEKQKNKTLIRGRDLNTHVCFMRGITLSLNNIKKAISIMDEWNSRDRSSDYEYPTGWRKYL